MNMIVSFLLVPRRNKLLALVYFSDGSAMYRLARGVDRTLKIFLGARVHRSYKTRLGLAVRCLFQVRRLSYVCCAELSRDFGAKYVRAPGVCSRVMQHNSLLKTALLILPSGARKIFSSFSLVLIGRLANANHKLYRNGKAGF